MDKFEAFYNEGIIYIKSNTNWCVKVKGNIMLSSYSGVGDGELKVFPSPDMKYGYGELFFTYGDLFCSNYNKLYISLFNKSYFKAVPNYLCFNGENSVAYSTIYTNDDYEILNPSTEKFTAIKYDNSKIMVVSNTSENFGCDDNEVLKLKDANNNLIFIDLYQCIDENIDDNCILKASYTNITEHSANVKVTSLIGSKYANFKWEEVKGVKIAKLTGNSLLCEFDGIDKFTLKLSNACTNISIDIYASYDDDKVFNVAMQCNGITDKSHIFLSVVSASVDSPEEANNLISENQKTTNLC